MPRHTIPVPNSYHTITRPIAIQVTKDLITQLGFEKSTSIVFAGQVENIATQGSTLTTDDVNDSPLQVTRQRAVITISEEYLEHRQLSENPEQHDADTIFHDPKLNMMLKPIYTAMVVDITVSLIAKDEVVAKKWYQSIKNRVSRDLMNTVHVIDYRYAIPDVCMQIIFEIHRLREANAGYNETLSAYVSKYFNKRFGVLSNSSGKKTMPIVRESQVQVHGIYDFGMTPPKPERDGETGGYAMSFNYKFIYNKPDQLYIKYPFFVHNQHIPEKYIDTTFQPFENNLEQRKTASNRPLDHFSSHRDHGSAYSASPGIPMPFYDDWLPSSGMVGKNFANLIRPIISLDADLMTLINLTDLDPWALSEHATNYLLANYNTLNKPYHNVFTIKLYEGDNLLPSNSLTVLPDLTIKSTVPLDIRKNYHVTMDILTDPSMLTNDALLQLGVHGCLTYEWIQMLTGNVDKYFTTKPVNCTVRPEDIYVIIDKLVKGNNFNSSPYRSSFYTVGQYTIIARRKDANS